MHQVTVKSAQSQAVTHTHTHYSSIFSIMDQTYLHVLHFHYTIVGHLFYSVCGCGCVSCAVSFKPDQQLWLGPNPVIYLEYLWNYGGLRGLSETALKTETGSESQSHGKCRNPSRVVLCDV